MKQNCLGLQYRDLSSRAHHFVMKPFVCEFVWILYFFMSQIFILGIFHSKSKLLYPQMLYLVLDAIKTYPIISYLGTDANLI